MSNLEPVFPVLIDGELALSVEKWSQSGTRSLLDQKPTIPSRLPFSKEGCNQKHGCEEDVQMCWVSRVWKLRKTRSDSCRHIVRHCCHNEVGASVSGKADMFKDVYRVVITWLSSYLYYSWLVGKVK